MCQPSPWPVPPRGHVVPRLEGKGGRWRGCQQGRFAACSPGCLRVCSRDSLLSACVAARTATDDPFRDLVPLSPPAPNQQGAARGCPDEAVVLAAMRQARFSLWRIERDHETTGLILRDLLREEEIWLIDEAMVKNARPGQEMAARLVEPDRFAMTARVIVPIIPDLMTRPELIEEVFIRAPALRSLEGKALAKDPHLAIGIYRAAVATGVMDFIRFKRKGQPSACKRIPVASQKRQSPA